MLKSALDAQRVRDYDLGISRIATVVASGLFVPTPASRAATVKWVLPALGKTARGVSTVTDPRRVKEEGRK